MKGKNILEFIKDKEEQQHFKEFWEDIKAGQSKELTVKRQNKMTGNDIWLINQYNPILDDNGKVIEIVYLAVDITEQKRLEQELIIQEKIMNQNMQELFAEYQNLEDKYETLKKLEEDIKEKHDTEIDKLYDNWLNSFE
jgi:methyl-accepting chemotaxis protein